MDPMTDCIIWQLQVSFFNIYCSSQLTFIKMVEESDLYSISNASEVALTGMGKDMKAPQRDQFDRLLLG